MNSEEKLRQAAKSYADAYGASLMKELAALEGIKTDTPRMDKRIRRIRKRGAEGWLIGSSVAAACLLLIALSVSLVGRITNYAPEVRENEIIPITFALPVGYTLDSSELDNGKTVHSLSNVQLGNVVLTMEPSSSMPEYEGFEPVAVGRTTAYARSGPDYDLLAFQEGKILYELSGESGLSPLIGLAENICADM